MNDKPTNHERLCELEKEREGAILKIVDSMPDDAVFAVLDPDRIDWSEKSWGGGFWLIAPQPK